MPLSEKASTLLADGKLFYGDPCYEASWGDSIANCKEQGTNLAQMVLEFYDIPITGTVPENEYSSCCPLDILSQDPFACIKMSLSAMLLDDEYWECYANEFGEAEFIRVLDSQGHSRTISPTSRIQYCIPTLQPADIADLVIVRGADPAPFRKCGDWYTVIDSGDEMTEICAQNHIFVQGSSFSDEDIASWAKGIKFSWGQVAGAHYNFQDIRGNTGFGTSATCEAGNFNQYGSIIYPDYERKQIYNDGIRDVFELAGFEQILFWLVDIDYGPEGLSDEMMRHYSIQFTKSAQMPVCLEGIGKTSAEYGESYFPPTCVLDTGLGLEYTIDLRGSSSSIGSNTCKSVQDCISAGKNNSGDSGSVQWDEYAIPNFYAYATGRTNMSFKEVSKWNIAGIDICGDNQFDNLYDSTTSMMGTVCVLNNSNWFRYGQDVELVDLGEQKARHTAELDQSFWVEVPPSEQDLEGGRLDFIFRAEAPSDRTIYMNYPGIAGWYNPVYHTNALWEYVYDRFWGTVGSRELYSTFKTSYDYPGRLIGIGDQLYTVEDLWAVAAVNRPGITIRGQGRGVDNIMQKINLRVMPVYEVNFPSATAAAGENWPQPGCDYCIDPYEELVDATYCEIRVDEQTCSEKLQEVMTGNTIDITLPFLFPDFETYNPAPGGGEGGDRGAFDKNCTQCVGVARFLWDYISTYKDKANKGYTYICGPPRSQQEVPRLGQSIMVPGGELRCVNSISYSYSDASSFLVNLEVGPISVTNATAGLITKKATERPDLKGRIISHVYGALYKVDVPGIGVIKAWNIYPYPWDAGDKVTVTLYNHPVEI